MTILRISMKDVNFGFELMKSFRETGFAVLTDHDLDLDLLAQYYKDWEDFFANDERKKTYMNGEDQSGYFPMNSEKAKGAIVADLKEFFHYYPSKIQDPTIGVTEEVYRQLNEIAKKTLIALEDQLPAGVRTHLSQPLHWMIQSSDMTLLRILHYPPIEDVPQGAVRAAEHEDINLITILPGATEMGLEVKDVEGNWMPIEAGTKDLVVNVGDMLQEATNGYLKSTPHRVVNIGMNKSRFSSPLFLHPRPDVVLSNKYTAEQYLDERLRELGLK